MLMGTEMCNISLEQLIDYEDTLEYLRLHTIDVQNVNFIEYFIFNNTVNSACLYFVILSMQRAPLILKVQLQL